jgi:peptidyl-tRNA hydrolase, PTH1 family
MDPASFVLRDFAAPERKDLPFLLDRCADAAETLVSKGLDVTQTMYHAEPGADS